MTARCMRCGSCCRAEGYVRLTEADIERLARALQMDAYTFTERYTRVTRDRACLSLTEKADGSCVFLNETAGCVVNSAKPSQCRDFPTRWRFSDAETVCAALQGSAGH